MQLKSVLIKLLEKFLGSNLWFVYFFLDNPLMRSRFLDKYLRNRPEQFFAYFSWKPVPVNSKNILVLKTDAIGDYLLFRNYLSEIAAFYKPKGYRIILAGNKAWKELATELDSDQIDEFIWLDRGGMNRRPSTEKQLEFLEQINQHTYGKLLYPNFSREWEAGDWLVKHIPSKEKFGFDGNVVNQTEKQHQEGNTFYNLLLRPEISAKFDFYRNGEITSSFTGRQSRLKAPKINLPEIQAGNTTYAVFFPGASSEPRRWPEERFAELGNFIHRHLGLNIILTGGPSETELCQRIADANPEIFENLAGKTSLPQLLRLISQSALLVSNDTSAIHMGAQCGVPSFCLYKGNNYGRCMPYPDGLLPNLVVCMPKSLLEINEEDRINRFSENDGGDIREITVDTLRSLIIQLSDK